MYAYVVKATANERKDESLPSEPGDVCYHFYFLKTERDVFNQHFGK